MVFKSDSSLALPVVGYLSFSGFGIYDHHICRGGQMNRGGLKSGMQHLAAPVRCEDDEKIQAVAG